MIINKDLTIQDNYSLKTLCDKIANLEKHINPILLWYNNGNPTTNNLTLAYNATDFSRIKIYYISNGIKSCLEISDIKDNNKYSLATESEGGIPLFCSWSCGAIYFSGKSLMWYKNNTMQAWTNSESGHNQTVMAGSSDWYTIKIYKVEGYYS